MRFCEAQSCTDPVFGTCKVTRKGYCRKHQTLREDFDRRTILQKGMDKQKRLQGQIRSLGKQQANKELVAELSKSELLKEADRLFSLFIRDRDSDKNGNISCVCCGKVYNVKQEDSDGNKIVQCLHFIDRDVYSLRFDEDNAHSGCGYCNLDMHLHKDGLAYRMYLQFMNTEYGEDAVAEMTLAHRKINKLEITQLKNIIEHYAGKSEYSG